jgi:hypothetical protein
MVADLLRRNPTDILSAQDLSPIGYSAAILCVIEEGIEGKLGELGNVWGLVMHEASPKHGCMWFSASTNSAYLTRITGSGRNE